MQNNIYYAAANSNGYNIAPEADINMKWLEDLVIKGATAVLNFIHPGTTVVVYNDTAYLKLMYRCVDNSMPYDQFIKNRTRVEAGFEFDYTPSPKSPFYKK